MAGALQSTTHMPVYMESAGPSGKCRTVKSREIWKPLNWISKTQYRFEIYKILPRETLYLRSVANELF